MAYIDPEGMFGGDRMAILSDGARYAWPWFVCAANTCGRVKLDYRDFMKIVFRQFKKAPTEEQFWDWVAQYHECFLMFVYQVDGEAWGAWWVKDRYLPKYKLKADEETPKPNDEEFSNWKENYQNRKRGAFSGKCRVLSNSENLREISKDSPVFKKTAMERRGEERITTEEKPMSETLPFVIEPNPVIIGFHEWWRVWWNKSSKRDAEKAFPDVAKKYGVQFLIDQCVADRNRFEPTEHWGYRQNLLPATWLRGRKWEDELNVNRVLPRVSTDQTRRNEVVSGLKIIDQIKGRA